MQVIQLYKEGSCIEGDELLSLSRGPSDYATSFSGCITNGYSFHTNDRDKNLRTQNSGVFVVGNIGDGSNNIDYYGILNEIIILEYLGGNYVALFRYKWWNVHYLIRGIKIYKFGIVSLKPEVFED